MPSISQEVMTVLSAAQIDGVRLILVGKLDRKLYTETNKVLDAVGGTWDRKTQAHVFDGDAAEAIEPILLTGEYSRTKQDFGQFDTPPKLADRIVEMADITPETSIMEPSAGIGNLVGAVIRRLGNNARIFVYEIDAKRYAKCADIYFTDIGFGWIAQRDFLEIDPLEHGRVDRVIMNPPFAKQADIDHVLHAYRFLGPCGLLVAIMSAGVTFRQDRKTLGFRDFVLEAGGTIEELPPGSFKSSGAMVNACVVKIPA